MKRILRNSALSLMVVWSAYWVAAYAEEEAAAVDGATLYRTKICASCHGADARTSILPLYPKIAGQNAAYALQQMRDMKAGVRTNGLSAIMNEMMYLVTDTEMKVLAEYLATLDP